jgi:hypothetical protein
LVSLFGASGGGGRSDTEHGHGAGSLIWACAWVDSQKLSGELEQAGKEVTSSLDSLSTSTVSA